jgi:hypothetical protein
MKGMAFPRKKPKGKKLTGGRIPVEEAVFGAGELAAVELPLLGKEGINQILRHRGVSIASGPSFSLVEKRSLDGRIVFLLEALAPVESGFVKFKCVYDSNGNPIGVIE